MGVVLEIKAGALAGKMIGLRTGESVTVGRSAAKAEFALAQDTFMSGLHFAVECGKQGYRVVDRKSSNGTFLNGRKIQEEALLANGDEIKAGQTIFTVKIIADDKMAALGIAPKAAPSTRDTPVVREPAQREIPPRPRRPGEAERNPSSIAGKILPREDAQSPDKLPLPLRSVEPQPDPQIAAQEKRAEQQAEAPGPEVEERASFRAIPSPPVTPPQRAPDPPRAEPSRQERPPYEAERPKTPDSVSQPTSEPALRDDASLRGGEFPERREIGASKQLQPREENRPRSGERRVARAASAFRVMGWSFPPAPPQWQIQEGFGLQETGGSDFPGSVAATEEPLGGITLQQFVESQISTLRGYLRDARIEPTLPPRVGGADESMAVDVRHQTKDGRELVYRRIYARSGSSVGVLTVTTVTAQLLQVLETLRPMLEGASFEATV